MRRALVAGLAGLALLTACSATGRTTTGEAVRYGADPAAAQPTAVPTSTTAKPAVAAPASTTTARPRPTATTTTTAAPAPGAAQSKSGAMVTIVSTYPGAVIVELNGISHTVPAKGNVGPVGIIPQPDGADYFRIANDAQTCGGTDSDDYFEVGGTYELRLSPKAGEARCDGTDLPLIMAVLHPSGQQLL